MLRIKDLGLMADVKKQKRQQDAGATGEGAIISRNYSMLRVIVCQEKNWASDWWLVQTVLDTGFMC